MLLFVTNYWVVITQVFPDEFHLNTLDQLLSAIARLNPHVNIKAIVIGLMDRLSSYAAREAESESLVDRKQSEEAATIRLLHNLQLAKEEKFEAGPNKVGDTETNGEQPNGDKARESPENHTDKSGPEDSKSPSDNLDNDHETSLSKENRGIPDNVKLYEIFFGQVTNLVNAQRLHVQDIMALLVSLTNLAL